MKRLAKLGGSSPRPSSPGTAAKVASPTPASPQPPKPKPQPKVTPSAPVASTSSSPATPVKRAPVGPAKLDPGWEHATVGHVMNVTLDVRTLLVFNDVCPSVFQRQHAEKNGYQIVWLKYLQEELKAEQSSTRNRSTF